MISSEAPTRTRFRRRSLAGVVVLLLIAGAVSGWYLERSRTHWITVDGVPVLNATQALTSAEGLTLAQVHSRHGVAASDARCYFTRAGGSTRSTDTDSHAFCGPVLFVDGDPAAEYLDYLMTISPVKGGVNLSVTADDLRASLPQPLLVAALRPDGKTPPGHPTLKAPTPPAAAASSITADLDEDDSLPAVSTLPTLGDASTTFTVTNAGYVKRFGQGDGARSAGPGQRLFEFRVVSKNVHPQYASSFDSGQFYLSIDGQARRPLSISFQTSAESVVVSAPSAVSRLELILVSGSLTQEMSLLDGKPGAGVVPVLSRTNRDFELTPPWTAVIPAQVNAGGDRFVAHLNVTALDAELVYQAPDGTVAPPGMGLLLVYLHYSAPEFVDPTATHAFRASILTLGLPDGTSIPATDHGQPDGVVNSFVVPAGFTSGVVTLNGVDSSGDGWSMTLKQPSSFRVILGAG